MDAIDRQKIIAVIDFTKLDNLFPKEHKDLSFFTSFLHSYKKFVNPVTCPSRSWGGKMWELGWRKAMVTAQLIGHYICQSAVDCSQIEYDDFMQKSSRASSILGKMFNKMADIPFSKNQDLMAENNIPSFSNLKFHNPIAKDNFSPHLTFTSDRFFNKPKFKIMHLPFFSLITQ
jgi:hypothetical protein